MHLSSSGITLSVMVDMKNGYFLATQNHCSYPRMLFAITRDTIPGITVSAITYFVSDMLTLTQLHVSSLSHLKLTPLKMGVPCDHP